jgi:hypothetical protein
VTRGGVLAAIALGIMMGHRASAQEASRGRISVAVGPAWIGGATLPLLNVTETQADGSPRSVLTVAREMTSAIAIEARVGVRLTSRLDVEAVGSYARPQLRLTTSNDVEAAPATTASEDLQQFTVGGGASWFLIQRTDDHRTLPFVEFVLAYARQLHTPGTLAESGTAFDMGGGVTRVLLTRRGKLKSVGVRADVRARVRPKSFFVDGRTHASPAVGASLDLHF